MFKTDGMVPHREDDQKHELLSHPSPFDDHSNELAGTFRIVKTSFESCLYKKFEALSGCEGFKMISLELSPA